MPSCEAVELEAGHPRPVSVRARDYQAGFRLPAHWHRRSQLLYSVRGTITVTTRKGVWVIPPSRAAWVPAGAEHGVRSSEDVSMRSVFVDPSVDVALDGCCVVSVTPLLRELILHAVAMQPLYEPGSGEERLMLVMLEQMRSIPTASIRLPMPTDRRIAKIADALIQNPADQRGLEEWAKEIGAASRTLSRLFPQETGMQFRVWQQQVRLIEALRLLSEGRPVTTVAYDVGYESPSAFVSMFKRALGRTPGQYFDH